MASRETYSTEELEFLREGYLIMTIPGLTVAFNAKFNQDKTPKQIKSTLQNHKIRCGRRYGERIYPESNIFTGEQVQFLKDNYKGRSKTELHALFNSQFQDNQKTLGQITAFTKNHGLASGLDCRFKSGTSSWNKGVTGYMGANVTSFKPGNLPHNHKRLWTERLSKDGYIEISVPETNPHTGFPQRYKLKHRWLWEVHVGPIPKGHILIFRDGDKLNCNIENLILVTRAEALSMNLHGFKDAPAELKPTILALAKVEAKAGIRTRPARGRKKSGRMNK